MARAAACAHAPGAWHTAGKDGETVNGNSHSLAALADGAALLKQYWPHLGGKEISRIMLDIATDLGAPGVD